MEGCLNCSQCSHRYKAFISACPRCGYPSPAKYEGSAKKSSNVKKLGVVAAVSAVAIVAVLFLILGKTPLSSVSISDQVGTIELNSPTNGTGSVDNNDENTSTADHDDVDVVDKTENKPLLAPIAELFQPTKPPKLSELEQYFRRY